jgi:phosphatidylserine/phosphatidylglycerophosphate/cardiolipin synthase-like enzyme
VAGWLKPLSFCPNGGQSCSRTGATFGARFSGQAVRRLAEVCRSGYLSNQQRAAPFPGRRTRPAIYLAALAELQRRGRDQSDLAIRRGAQLADGAGWPDGFQKLKPIVQILSPDTPAMKRGILPLLNSDFHSLTTLSIHSSQTGLEDLSFCPAQF